MLQCGMKNIYSVTIKCYGDFTRWLSGHEQAEWVQGLRVKVCSHLTFAFVFASTFNIASM